VDVSVGADVGAVVGAGVNGQSVSLGVGLGVCLVSKARDHSENRTLSRVSSVAKRECDL